MGRRGYIPNVTSGEAPKATFGGAYLTKDLRDMTYDEIMECLDRQLGEIEDQLDLERVNNYSWSQRNNLQFQRLNLRSQRFVLERLEGSERSDEKKLNDAKQRIAELNAKLIDIKKTYNRILSDQQNKNRQREIIKYNESKEFKTFQEGIVRAVYRF